MIPTVDNIVGNCIEASDVLHEITGLNTEISNLVADLHALPDVAFADQIVFSNVIFEFEFTDTVKNSLSASLIREWSDLLLEFKLSCSENPKIYVFKTHDQCTIFGSTMLIITWSRVMYSPYIPLTKPTLFKQCAQ